ncbi:MAG TPA: sialidase family protein [Gemmataceae bacterium]|nr:sialidase family protein [Gemmataceae bacterium]
MIGTPTKVFLALIAFTGLAFHTLMPVSAAPSTKTVTLLRVPDEGIQPQAAVDEKGTIHLIYFKGRPSAGDIFYVHSKDGATFSKPIRVNSKAESAMAIGNIRGAHLALGKNNRVHVAWMSGKLERIGDTKSAPMLYARLNDEGTAFEAQRNIIQEAMGLDGGGSVAADSDGNVYVTWHAPTPGEKGENNRRVWVAASADEGKTFSKEKSAFDEPTGACGCCGMRAFADKKGKVYMLYRAAKDSVDRDMYLLASDKKVQSYKGERLQGWKTEICPMSSGALAESKAGVLAAWETKDQIYFSTIDSESGRLSAVLSAPGEGRGRKHPALAGNDKGETILVWTEGMGWERGGSLAWQVYDKTGKPTEEKGRAEGVPMWSLVAVVARPDGGFIVIY